MQTRRKASLAGVPLRSLLLPFSSKCRKRDQSPQPQSPQTQPQPSSPLLRRPSKWAQRLEDARAKQKQLELEQQALSKNPPVVERQLELEKPLPLSRSSVFMIIDTESFRFGPTLLPLQIAWCVYKWSGSELQQISDMHTAYVAEIVGDPMYRDMLEEEIPSCLKKHENNMLCMPTQNSEAILRNISQSISDHGVSTLVGYNVSWDFAAIGSLIATFDVNLPGFSAVCDNPFNPMHIDYLDLMHETVKKYGKQLAAAGVEDGTIHRAEESNRLMLRKNHRYSKSIYSAAYVLQSFFGITQEHLAEHDVEHEALLLQKCLQDHGANALEYNICNPQANCYQLMLHWANELYVDPIDVGQAESDDVCLFDADDDYVPSVPNKDKEEI